MKPIRTMLIDDEYLAREEMKRALADFPYIQVIGEAASGPEALEKIREERPDLLLLDIQMPGMTGFDLLCSLEGSPEVIFVTAFDQYAVKAFEVNALDYLMKPVRFERLEKALEKIRSKWEENLPVYEKQIFIKERDGYFFLQWNTVHLIESMGNYACLYFDNKKTLLKRSLNQLEAILDPARFFRINRTQIINLPFIETIKTLDKGRLAITLNKGENQTSPLQVSYRQSIHLKRLDQTH